MDGWADGQMDGWMNSPYAINKTDCLLTANAHADFTHSDLPFYITSQLYFHSFPLIQTYWKVVIFCQMK